MELFLISLSRLDMIFDLFRDISFRNAIHIFRATLTADNRVKVSSTPVLSSWVPVPWMHLHGCPICLHCCLGKQLASAQVDSQINDVFRLFLITLKSPFTHRLSIGVCCLAGCGLLNQLQHERFYTPSRVSSTPVLSSWNRPGWLWSICTYRVTVQLLLASNWICNESVHGINTTIEIVLDSLKSLDTGSLIFSGISPLEITVNIPPLH